MEDSCPATPLVLAGRDSKSPLQVALSSPESGGMKSPSRDSPDSQCVICLGRLQNKSFTDSCLHQFCFQCLLQWSKIKAECPLCKQPFKSIIHNVRSNLDYDQYHVEHGEPRFVLPELVHSYNFDLFPVDRRFRYRSTMTREYFRELAESFLAHTRILPEDSYQIHPIVPVDLTSASADPSSRRYNRFHGSLIHQRARQRGTTDFRRNIYNQDLWVQDLADISGRYRECTPQFYRENQAQIHRIIPWLNREVNVLLSDCESHAAYVLDQIISILPQHSIRSREFRELVQPYFGDRTDHFVHELYTFARSVYDITGFDQHAVYGTNPNYATEVQEISSSSDDSDIEILETVKSEIKKIKKASKRKKIGLKRGNEKNQRSDEPVAGPSGLNSLESFDPIEICDSDMDDIKIIESVKPIPEVVTISSGDESYNNFNLLKNEEDSDVKSPKIRKSRKNSSDTEYLPSNDKRKYTHKKGKGKCKSNGFGLKGKQKRKYIKLKKRRSASTSSSVSYSSGRKASRSRSRSTSTSTSSSSSSSSSRSRSSSSTSSGRNKSSRGRRNSVSSLTCDSDEYKSSRKKNSKISSKRYKSKSKNKSVNKVIETKRQKLTCDIKSEKGKTIQKRKVKSCVIVPNPKTSLPSSSSFECQQEPHYLAPYWSIVPNPAAVKKHRLSSCKKKFRDSSPERTSKRVRESSSERYYEESSRKWSNGERKKCHDDVKLDRSRRDLSAENMNVFSTSASPLSTENKSTPVKLTSTLDIESEYD